MSPRPSGLSGLAEQDQCIHPLGRRQRPGQRSLSYLGRQVSETKARLTAISPVKHLMSRNGIQVGRSERKEIATWKKGSKGI